MKQEDILIPALQRISEREFERFRDLIHQQAGIWLGPTKIALLVGRCSKRLRELGLHSFSDYFDLITKDESGEELRRLLNRISTNKTSFFREQRHFDHLTTEVVPRLMQEVEEGRRQKQIRVWSAACASGEEPYTIAMVLLDLLPPEKGWDVQILATDLSTDVLSKAVDGVWPIARAGEIPERYLKAYMLKGTRSQHGNMRAGPQIRSAVRFQQMNLVDPAYPVDGKFDVIFCRNVLIYFDQATKERVVNQLFSHLHDDGVLYVGHAESLHSLKTRARSIAPSIYIHAHYASKVLRIDRARKMPA